MSENSNQNADDGERSLNRLGIWAGIIGAALAALAFFGFGSISDVFDFLRQDSADGRNLSRSEYIKQSDQLCLDTFARQQRIVDTMQPGVNRVEAQLKEVGNLLAAWDALDEPIEDEGKIADMMSNYNSAYDEEKKGPDLILKRDLEAYEQVAERSDMYYARGNALAKAYGFKYCKGIGAR
ncbi:hypothetical protein ACFQ7M_06870 [Streptomyces massasporeus]